MDGSIDRAETWSAAPHVPRALGLRLVEPLTVRAEWLCLAELWRSLTRGEQQLVEHRYTDDRCIATLQRVRRPIPLKARRVEALQRVLLGESAKSVAFDLGVAMSSVASSCSEALTAIGAGRLPSRAPVLMVMAAHAAYGLRLHALAIEQAAAPNGSPLELSCPRPDSTLKTRVTRSEFEVVRAFVEGASHASIAERYRCSPRTIANHLGSVFRKLRVSGRAELLSCLIREHAA